MWTLIMTPRTCRTHGGGAFDVVLSDPPYSEAYARELYDVELASPKAHFTEAARVLKPGGTLLILDWLVYMNYRPHTLNREEPVGVTCGPNTRIRVLNVFHKPRTLSEWTEE